MRCRRGSMRVPVILLACLLTMAVSAVRVWRLDVDPPIPASSIPEQEVDPVDLAGVTPAFTMSMDVTPPAPTAATPSPVLATSSDTQSLATPCFPLRQRSSIRLAGLFDGQANYGIPARTIQLATRELAEESSSESDDAPASTAPPTGTPTPTPPALKRPGLVQTPSLLAELELLHSERAIAWAQEVRNALDALNQASGWDSSAAGDAIRQLARLAQTAEEISAKLPELAEQTQLRVAGYSVQRRAQVWYQMHLANAPIVMVRLSQEARYLERDAALRVLNAVEPLFPAHAHGGDWRNFLGLAEIRSIFLRPEGDHDGARGALAAEILRRIDSTELSAAQQEYFQRPPVAEYVQLLRRCASSPLDWTALAACIESAESQDHPTASTCLANHWHRLSATTIPEYRRLATALDHHYRNSNLRISVTGVFLNRFLPAMEHVRSPVREEILGADVRGQSESLNKLRVTLVPDPDEVRIKLEVKGRMEAETRATQGGVTMFNHNNSHYLIEKFLSFDGLGWRVGNSQGNTSADTRLLGMQTQYDAFPLIGTMVRRIANQRHQETKSLTRQIISQRVENKVKKRIDAKLEEQMAQTGRRLDQKIMEPLREMELDPETLRMYTTAERVVVHGRLAGQDQLGAFSARPRAVADSLLSFQMHESAANNLIDRLNLKGRDVELKVLIRELLDQWDLQSVAIPADIPDGLRVTLAKEQPVAVRCDDDQVQIAMRIRRFVGEKGRKFQNFEVRARFVPQADGFRCDLVRDGSLEIRSISRRSLGRTDRFAISAIFTRVFSKNQRFALINKELSDDPRLASLDIDQVVIRDGWIGVSVGERPTPQVARRPSPSHSTSGRRLAR